MKELSDQDEVVSEFLAESRDNLEQFDRAILAVENGSSTPEVFAGIFRHIHNIKGASSFLDLPKLEALTHAAEDLLSLLRDGKLRTTTEVCSLLLEVSDHVRRILVELEATGSEPDDDHRQLIERLQCLAVSHPFGAAQPQASSASPLDHPSYEDESKPIGQLLVERAGVDPVAVAAARELQRLGDLRTIGDILVSHGAVSPASASEVVAYQQALRFPGTCDNSVRIDIARLETWDRLVHELSILREQLLLLARQEATPALNALARQLDRIASEMERESKLVRTQPIGVLWGRLPRLVRDLALTGGKQVRLVFEGEGIGLDRSILQTITDPLLHLVRNAVDHGIETPQVRAQSGKPAEGLISLRAFLDKCDACIEVKDDGSGINLVRVRQQAVRLGAISADQASRVSDAEIAQLVFLPGLTTSETVTMVSGRGVGMDVVKTNAQKMGGSVEVVTQKGKGTTVTLRIPVPPQSASP